MAMKRAVLLLSSLLIAADATSHSVKSTNVYCPHHHCLKRVKPGAGAGSFHCVRHADYIGHVCAQEKGNCTCPNGKIKYGNWDYTDQTGSYSEIWTEPIKGGTTAQICNNDRFSGDPKSGMAKVCHCTPHGVTAKNVNVPNKTQVVNASCGEKAPDGWGVPTCIEGDARIVGLETSLAAMPGLGPLMSSGMPTWQIVYGGLGFNLGTANVVTGFIWNLYMGSTLEKQTCHVVSHNIQTVTSTVQCNVTGNYKTTLQKFDLARADNTDLQKAKDQFVVLALPQLGNTMGAVIQAAVNYGMTPTTADLGAAPADCTYVPVPDTATSGVAKSGLAMISMPIMLAASAWFQ